MVVAHVVHLGGDGTDFQRPVHRRVGSSSPVTSVRCWSSHSPQLLAGSTSGIRGCTSASSPNASVVTTAHVTSGCRSPGGNQAENTAAMANSAPSDRVHRKGCLRESSGRHSYQPVAGIKQRRRAADSAKEGLLVSVSARALINGGPLSACLAHVGINPQRTGRMVRCPPRSTTIGTVLVGVT